MSRRLFALAALALLASPLAAGSLEEAPRVRQARVDHGASARALFAAHGLPYPSPIYLRAFKHEGELELWAGPTGQALTLLKTYPICAASGQLGPKRQRGDLQVPEGFYQLDRFNPASNFHLSLRVSYPNALDRALKTARDPGGDIYIHGACVTIGCLPLQDGPVAELFVIALDARAAGQRPIPVHIFPTRMDDAGMARLEQLIEAGSPHGPFWRSLRPAYLAFEADHRVPRMRVDARGGGYQLVGSGRRAAARR